MYTIHEIANGLTELLSEQKFVEAYQQLFADDAESIDPLNAEQSPLKGLENLVAREKDFLSRTDIHKITVSHPIVANSYFTLSLHMDFTIAGQDKMRVEELCVYKVKDGKIVSQQFFIG
ncbi:MAG: nuclear transport factor 2 family protein [Mucilaginibacter sp.]|nr:nuclear transport factor 2 family protein [Mucilaginibacter sp.]